MKKLTTKEGNDNTKEYNDNTKEYHASKLRSEIEAKLSYSPDLIVKEVYIDGEMEGFFIFLISLTDRQTVERCFISKILEAGFDILADKKRVFNLPCAELFLAEDTNTIVQEIIQGRAVFICDGLPYAIICNTSGYDKRSINEPETEKNVKGSHEGFIEDLETNISMLRRRMKNSRLKFRTLSIGTLTSQKIAIVYLEGIADSRLVEMIYKKITSIDFDGFNGVSYIEQFITDNPNSIFPQYLSTERSDKTVAALLEGRIAIMMDSTPVTLIVPVSFISFFQSMEDYNFLWLQGSFLRLLRIFALFLSMTASALYVAVTSYHYYAVPLSLLIPLGTSRADVPFPPIIEVLILETTIELVREAAIRLPTFIGTSISVVAGLIIGQAAVEAGIVSNLLIIVVAVTAIASFTIPSNEMSLAVRMYKFSSIFAASVFGITGIVIWSTFLLGHLVSLESFGQPYFQPFIPFKPKDLKDAVFRLPIKYLRNRPTAVNPKDDKRGKRDG